MLNQDQIERFRDSGVVFPVRPFLPEQISLLTGEVNNLIEMNRQSTGPAFYARDLHERFPFIRELASNPRLLGAVESVLQSEPYLFGARIFCKEPGDGVRIGWHQDVPFWGFASNSTVVAWVAIDDSDFENGAMQVIPGTQDRCYFSSDLLDRYMKELKDQTFTSDEALLSKYDMRISPTPEELKSAIVVSLKRGEVSLHSGNVVHGSEPNVSFRRRCGLTLRYVAADAVQFRPSARGDFFTPLRMR